MLSIVSLFAEHNEPREQRKQELRQQIAYYRSLPSIFNGKAHHITDRAGLEALRSNYEAGGEVWGFVIALEGADLLDAPGDMALLYEQGVRIAALTWNERNQWAGGAKQLGGVQKQGEELLVVMRELQMILDVSHINQQSFNDEMRLWDGPVCATHGNPHALCRHPRNYTDAQLANLRERGAVAGILLYNALISSQWSENGPQVGLGEVCAHIEHMLEQLGPQGVGIGSDFDGGPLRNHTPEGLDTAADLLMIGEALAGRGHSAEAAAAVLGENWYGFLMRHLP